MDVKVRFMDLQRQSAQIRDEALAALAAVFDSGRYTSGAEVEAFEQEFAAYCEAEHAVAVNSGTSALHIALLAAGVRAGDEVITTPMTFAATVAAIRYCGAVPVFVDVEPVTLTLDPAGVERAITPRTKAILPVHLYGCAADVDAIADVAHRNGLKVIEDAAQAHGGVYQGRKVGSLGDLACFSFYPTKNLGACGEGGAVVTSDAALAAELRRLRNWGQASPQAYQYPGFNYRMDEFQGALLRIKLRRLDEWIEARRERADWYRELLEGVIEMPSDPADVRHVYHLFVVQPPNRAEFREALDECGVQTGVHYPDAVHQAGAFAIENGAATRLPVAENAAARVVSLPLYPELTRAEVEIVAAAVREALRPDTASVSLDRLRQATGDAVGVGVAAGATR